MGKDLKCQRVLALYTKLLNGEVVQKEAAAREFDVTPRTVQRDIEEIRGYFANDDSMKEYGKSVVYRRECDGYRLEDIQNTLFTEAEIYAVSKILLESRALEKAEMEPILDKLYSNCLSVDGRKKIKDLLLNERYNYLELQNKKALVDIIWKLANAVEEHRYLELSYQRMVGNPVIRRVRPVGIMFSEFYFYLIAYLDRGAKKDPEKKEYPYPAIYRIDRIEKAEVLPEQFWVNYGNRFEEGELRKRIQFMYGGELQTVVFEYSGLSVEAVLDKLPTAKIISEKDGVVTISAETFGKGIFMWLRSQGDKVKLLEPVEGEATSL